jgi:hypothetical protein
VKTSLLRWILFAALAGAASSIALAPPVAVASAPRVTLAFLPGPQGPAALAAAGLSPGLLNAGLDSVPAAQTYLDFGQGNRVFDSLYAGDLPPIGVGRAGVLAWDEIRDRAASAPADIVPGLLASTLAGAGIGSPRGAAIEASVTDPEAALLAADRQGRIGLLPPGCAARGCLPPVRVIEAGLGAVPGLVRGLRGRDLLIALSRPPPPDDRQLAIGIAGAGYDGNLTSDSTRIDGYVLSTDLAPTVLHRFGVETPSEMSGEPIRSEGSLDAGAVASLAERMAEIQPRRGPVIGVSLLAWVLATALAVAIGRGGAARAVLPLLAVTIVYVPAVLLVTSALRPSEAVEWALVLFGAPVLATLTLRLAPGYRGLALACGIVATAQAVDVIAGSPATSLSLMGPNPGLGVRFFGIGNELEAALVAIIVFGTGAAIGGFAPALPARSCALAFVAVAALGAMVFALGRFGADVGAAIVLPIGGGVAAAMVLGGRRWALLAAAASPLLVLGALAAIDLASGGDAHLTRSVLDAGGLDDVADVAERRLRLSARSFGRGVMLPLLPLAAAAIVLGVRYRHRLLGWLTRPPLQAAFAGTAAAIAAGTLANDSGALVLEVGIAYLLAFAGFAWAEVGRRPGGRP